jgi:uncharacterized RmlC-like cupin family protein
MKTSVFPVVTRKSQEYKDTAQSGGAVRISGVSPQHTPATKIWFGKVSNEPGYRSLPHHHGEAETGAFVLKGANLCATDPRYGSRDALGWIPAFDQH